MLQVSIEEVYWTINKNSNTSNYRSVYSKTYKVERRKLKHINSRSIRYVLLLYLTKVTL